MAHADCDGSLRNQILMIERLPSGEAIADHLVFVIVPLILLGAKGTKGLKLKSACHLLGRNAILLLICSLDFLITGAHAELKSNEAEVPEADSINIGVCAPPHVWEIRDYALKAVAVSIFAAMTTIGVAVVGGMFYLRAPVLAIPPVVPEIQAIPASVQALPIIPVVQGDDLDGVLVRAPIPTRLNSPLSWL